MPRKSNTTDRAPLVQEYREIGNAAVLAAVTVMKTAKAAKASGGKKAA